MQFENDLLISYAHIDDQALISGDRGWVSRLHRLLEIRVAQLRGQTPKIWRDPKLTGNDYFADTITERLPRVAALVSVLSPRYVQSEWCNRELKEFCRAAQQTGGIRVADKARIFKVVKTPVSRERLPEEVQPMLGYDFFIYDEAGRPRELAQDDHNLDRAFLTKLDDLAYDIVQLLDLLEGGEQTPVIAAPKAAVYLAETTFELREDRESMKRDLLRNGYEVLPDSPFPLVADEFDAFVREQLQRCKLSIHLVGRNYGIVPDGSTRSIVARQQELASQLAASTSLTSLIWLAPDLEVEDERQRAFIRDLHEDESVHASAEVLEVPFEDLKTTVFRTLEPPAAVKPHVPMAVQAQTVKRIYLLCDQQDVDATRALEDHLFQEGCEVILPIFDEDEAQVRVEHEETLKTCDAAILYYGSASELWLRRKLREMQRAAALGRTAPLPSAIYVAAPHTPHKQRFRTLEATLIREPDSGFDAAALTPFLAALRDGAPS